MKVMTVPYRKWNEHRKKCQVCGKLIEDGELVHIQRVVVEKYYPVRGIMRFSKTLIWHNSCADAQRFGGERE